MYDVIIFVKTIFIFEYMILMIDWYVDDSSLTTFIVDDMYSRQNRENLLRTLKMQLSTKVKAFCYIFIVFLESSLSFEYFQIDK